MNMVQFDTLKYANKLKRSGVSEEQAEGMTEAMRQVLESQDIATKQDVELETETLRKEIEVVRKEIEVVRKEIEVAKTETIKWVAGMLFTQTGILLAAIIAVIKIFLMP